jgi:hypothetical protein
MAAGPSSGLRLRRVVSTGHFFDRSALRKQERAIELNRKKQWRHISTAGLNASPIIANRSQFESSLVYAIFEGNRH